MFLFYNKSTMKQFFEINKHYKSLKLNQTLNDYSDIEKYFDKRQAKIYQLSKSYGYMECDIKKESHKPHYKKWSKFKTKVTTL